MLESTELPKTKQCQQHLVSTWKDYRLVLLEGHNTNTESTKFLFKIEIKCTVNSWISDLSRRPKTSPNSVTKNSSARELYTMTLSWTAVCFLCLCFDLAWNLANCHIVLFSYLPTLNSLINKHAWLLSFFVNFCHHSFNFSCNRLKKFPPYFLFSCNKWKNLPFISM